MCWESSSASIVARHSGAGGALAGGKIPSASVRSLVVARPRDRQSQVREDGLASRATGRRSRRKPGRSGATLAEVGHQRVEVVERRAQVDERGVRLAHRRGQGGERPVERLVLGGDRTQAPGSRSAVKSARSSRRSATALKTSSALDEEAAQGGLVLSSARRCSRSPACRLGAKYLYVSRASSVLPGVDGRLALDEVLQRAPGRVRRRCRRAGRGRPATSSRRPASVAPSGSSSSDPGPSGARCSGWRCRRATSGGSGPLCPR